MASPAFHVRARGARPNCIDLAWPLAMKASLQDGSEMLDCSRKAAI
jgi:hypothetical protein